MSFSCQTPFTSFLICWKSTSWLLSSVRDELVPGGKSACSAQSIVYTCWPPVHLLGVSSKMSDSLCTSWHWKCHFLPRLGHKTSRASWMVPMRLWWLHQSVGTSGRNLTLCSVWGPVTHLQARSQGQCGSYHSWKCHHPSQEITWRGKEMVI